VDVAASAVTEETLVHLFALTVLREDGVEHLPAPVLTSNPTPKSWTTFKQDLRGWKGWLLLLLPFITTLSIMTLRPEFLFPDKNEMPKSIILLVRILLQRKRQP
jgi:hypothetical protein